MPPTLQDPVREITVRIPTAPGLIAARPRVDPERNLCRITIEPADPDQAQFWSLVVNGLGAAAGTGTEPGALAALVTAIATSTHPVVLVVDGHHTRPRPLSAVRTLTHDVLVETLTPKETEVLGHLAEMLSTDEIAAAMFVSANTVRTHVRGILRKLAVSRRADAVRRARALSLIDA